MEAGAGAAGAGGAAVVGAAVEAGAGVEMVEAGAVEAVESRDSMGRAGRWEGSAKSMRTKIC